MKGDGWFIRYGKKVVIEPVDDHERFLRATGENKRRLQRLGLSKDLIQQIPRIGLQREAFLSLILANSSLIRVREHGRCYVSFEYWAGQNDEVFRAIMSWCKFVGAGDMLLLSICNLKTKEIFRPLVLVFIASMRQGKRIKTIQEVNADLKRTATTQGEPAAKMQKVKGSALSSPALISGKGCKQ